jgi:hypothetical protein
MLAPTIHTARVRMSDVSSLLERYDEADDKLRFLSTCADDFASGPWFQNRYTEYAEFKTVSEGAARSNACEQRRERRLRGVRPDECEERKPDEDGEHDHPISSAISSR